MKLCIDCKHFVRDDVNWGNPAMQVKYGKCGRTSLVSPESGSDAIYERTKTSLFSLHCGKKAIFFEEK